MSYDTRMSRRMYVAASYELTGIRQKSAIHNAGVASCTMSGDFSEWDAMFSL